MKLTLGKCFLCWGQTWLILAFIIAWRVVSWSIKKHDCLNAYLITRSWPTACSCSPVLALLGSFCWGFLKPLSLKANWSLGEFFPFLFLLALDVLLFLLLSVLGDKFKALSVSELPGTTFLNGLVLADLWACFLIFLTGNSSDFAWFEDSGLDVFRKSRYLGLSLPVKLFPVIFLNWSWDMATKSNTIFFNLTENLVGQVELDLAKRRADWAGLCAFHWSSITPCQSRNFRNPCQDTVRSGVTSLSCTYVLEKRSFKCGKKYRC